jgi:hypothetical protein
LTPKKLGELWGYRYWSGFEEENGEIPLRIKYLKDFTRRVETTNLSVSFRYQSKIARQGGESAPQEYTDRFFGMAVSNYFAYKEQSEIGSQEREILNSTTLPLWIKMHATK